MAGRFAEGDRVKVARSVKARQHPIKKGATGTVKKVAPSGEKDYYTVKIDDREVRGGIVRLHEKYLRRA